MKQLLNATARVAGSAAIALLVTCSASAAPGEGANITGSWWFVGQYGPGMTLPTLVTFHGDRTTTASDAIMFGGIPGFPFKVTPFQGVWERTGPLSFGGTSLMLVFDSTTNALIGVARVRSDIQFDGDFNHLTGTLHGELLFCPTEFTCPDPTDRDAPWVPTTSGVPFTAVRVRHLPAGPLQ